MNSYVNEEKKVIVEAGTFGEHEIIGVDLQNDAGELVDHLDVSGKWLSFDMEPETIMTLKLQLKRYANEPTYHTPWSTAEHSPTLLKGRTGGLT